MNHIQAHRSYTAESSFNDMQNDEPQSGHI